MKHNLILKYRHSFHFSVHDSSAKLNSGILNGNLNQYGDFDQCLDVTASNENYQGQYCLAYLQPSAPNTAHFLNYLRRITQSHEVFKSNFDDVSIYNVFNNIVNTL